MISAAQIGTILGGVGLLLLGMSLLTSGLRLAAGKALHRLLARWTSTRLRGLASGALLTAVVQSSGAVTVSTIGFANAGLLTLPQAAWVVFGSNVGTTMTAWLVALVGLRLKIEALALPMLGVGVLLRLLRQGRRAGAIGEAVAGFGALFLGLAFLRDALGELSGTFPFSLLEGPELWRLVLAVAGGALVTTLMLSSSAALAIILATASQGLVSLHLGAALVVGANLGTTSSALLASVGAAPNARRVTALHVVFNLTTALAAMILLQPLVAAVSFGRREAGFAHDPAAELALFHTLFNVLGVLLMVPLAGPIVRHLERRFVSLEEDLARPRHIDRTVLEVPHVALEALRLESLRANAIATSIGRDAVRGPRELSGARSTALRRLVVAIGEHVRELGRVALPDDVARLLPQILRAGARQLAINTLAQEAQRARAELESLDLRSPPGLDAAVLELALDALSSAGADGSIDLSHCSAAREAFELARGAERERLLRASLAGELSVEATSVLLQLLALIRRLVGEAWKAAAAIEALTPKGSDGPPGRVAGDAELSGEARKGAAPGLPDVVEPGS